MQIMTGYTGKPHVTSDMARLYNIGAVSEQSYVLPVGKQLQAEIENNSAIRILSGVAMHQGCIGVTSKNGYDTVILSNGTQGMKRKDLIVLRYEKKQNTSVESMSYVVLRGNPVANNPSLPGWETGDIASGALISDMPLYEVEFDGINIVKVSKLFKTMDNFDGIASQISKFKTDTNNKFSRVDQCFFYIFQRSWESPNWLAKGAPGLYLMSPTDNPTNSPFPGEWGWMFNMDTVRFAYRNDITNRSASGPLYINTYSKDRWSGWLNELDRSGIGQTVEVGYYKNEWKLATEYYDIGNGRAALDTEYFKTDSQQSTITVKKDGVYNVEFSGTLRSESQNVIVWMKLFVNGSEHRALSNYMYHSGVHMAMNGSWTCELRKGDRLNARLALSTGGTVYATRACFMRVTKIK